MMMGLLVAWVGLPVAACHAFCYILFFIKNGIEWVTVKSLQDKITGNHPENKQISPT